MVTNKGIIIAAVILGVCILLHGVMAMVVTFRCTKGMAPMYGASALECANGENAPRLQGERAAMGSRMHGQRDGSEPNEPRDLRGQDFRQGDYREQDWQSSDNRGGREFSSDYRSRGDSQRARDDSDDERSGRRERHTQRGGGGNEATSYRMPAEQTDGTGYLFN